MQRYTKKDHSYPEEFIDKVKNIARKVLQKMSVVSNAITANVSFAIGKREQDAEMDKAGEGSTKKATAQAEKKRQRNVGELDQDRSTWDRCKVKLR